MDLGTDEAAASVATAAASAAPATPTRPPPQPVSPSDACGASTSSASTSGSEDANGERPICRLCWDCADRQPGGRISLRCHCTTGIHDRCLLRWVLSETGRENLQTCELCTGPWQGSITVSIPDLLEAAAAWKQSTSAGRPDQAEVAAALAQLRERNEALSQLAAQAEESEAARRRDWEQMKRVAARDRQLLLDSLEAERQWRRSNWKYLPAGLLLAAGAFLAGAAWHQQASVAAATAAGSSSGSSSAAGQQELTWELGQNFADPAAALNNGESLTLSWSNLHSVWRIPSADCPATFAEGPNEMELMAPSNGGSVTIMCNSTTAGDSWYACSVDSHCSLGLKIHITCAA
ncbi:blue copper -like [Chlorella sorokiniana]|uniref:Blue copper-like n=1 Tax=Chlorella sorokiniana TaxID=3076 RepID=A0A2P6TP33_CHLSO|nr:blue copper -like [Chlorella sorokiniana]|eukprot:PRW51096.1 blue copper -like [Chlorella sorokiniana]